MSRYLFIFIVLFLSGMPFSEYIHCQTEEEKIIAAVTKALQDIESFYFDLGRKFLKPILMATHADYAHFNRVGRWKHSYIKNLSKEIQGPVLSTDIVGFYEEQRQKANTAYFPHDREVGLYEKILVAMANLCGRSLHDDKLIVIRHFPGGGPEIELTEIVPYHINKSRSGFKDLQVFENLIQLPETRAVMVSHVSYAGLEAELREKYYDKYEKVYLKELQTIGLTAEDYQIWQKNRPASFSPLLIRGLLKEEMGFEGLVIADALIMGAVNYKLKEMKNVKLIGINNNAVKNEVILALFLVYSGIDFNLLKFSNTSREWLVHYTKDHEYFARCLKEMLDKNMQICKDYNIGCNLNNKASEKEIIDFLFAGPLLEAWVDTWDRGAETHQIFRRKYLYYYYQDKKILNNVSYFYKLMKSTDWQAMEPYFKKVIQAYYLNKKEKNH